MYILNLIEMEKYHLRNIIIIFSISEVLTYLNIVAHLA